MCQHDYMCQCDHHEAPLRVVPWESPLGYLWKGTEWFVESRIAAYAPCMLSKKVLPLLVE